MSFRINTERLLIRPWEAGDRPVFERFASDAEMMRYINHGRAWGAAHIDSYFKRQTRYLTEHGCCMGKVVLKQTGEIIGMGGIQPLEQAGVFELGWWIWKDYWNRGFATEMARGFVAYAFKIMNLPQVVAEIDPPNLASIRVAEKLGMRHAGTRNAHELAERNPDIEVVYYVLEQVWGTVG